MSKKIKMSANLWMSKVNVDEVIRVGTIIRLLKPPHQGVVHAMLLTNNDEINDGIGKEYTFKLPRDTTGVRLRDSFSKIPRDNDDVLTRIQEYRPFTRMCELPENIETLIFSRTEAGGNGMFVFDYNIGIRGDINTISLKNVSDGSCINVSTVDLLLSWKLADTTCMIKTPLPFGARKEVVDNKPPGDCEKSLEIGIPDGVKCDNDSTSQCQRGQYLVNRIATDVAKIGDIFRIVSDKIESGMVRIVKINFISIFNSVSDDKETLIPIENIGVEYIYLTKSEFESMFHVFSQFEPYAKLSEINEASEYPYYTKRNSSDESVYVVTKITESELCGCVYTLANLIIGDDGGIITSDKVDNITSASMLVEWKQLLFTDLNQTQYGRVYRAVGNRISPRVTHRELDDVSRELIMATVNTDDYKIGDIFVVPANNDVDSDYPILSKSCRRVEYGTGVVCGDEIPMVSVVNGDYVSIRDDEDMTINYRPYTTTDELCSNTVGRFRFRNVNHNSSTLNAISCINNDREGVMISCVDNNARNIWVSAVELFANWEYQIANSDYWKRYFGCQKFADESESVESNVVAPKLTNAGMEARRRTARDKTLRDFGIKLNKAPMSMKFETVNGAKGIIPDGHTLKQAIVRIMNATHKLGIEDGKQLALSNVRDVLGINNNKEVI